MKNGMPSQRQLRMGEQVRHALSDTLRRGKFHDADLLDSVALLSINEVRMSPDLKNAKAYVSSLTENGLEKVLEALNTAAPYFQKELSNKLDAKFTPRVRFVEDISQEAVNKLERIFDNLPKSADS